MIEKNASTWEEEWAGEKKNFFSLYIFSIFMKGTLKLKYK